MKKNCLVLMLVFALIIFSTSIGSSAADLQEIQIDSIADSQKMAVEAYNIMMESFENEKGEIIYPHEYAGAYVDEHKLVINLTSREVEITKKYEELLKNYNCIEYKLVTHSMNDLSKAVKETSTLLNKDFPVCGYYVDEMKNCGVIEIADGKETEALKAVKSYAKRKMLTYDSDIKMRIVAGTILQEESTSLINGTNININTSAYTYGISGIYQNSTVFLTAGHGVEVDDTVEKSGNTLGTVIFKRHLGSQGDFSIVSLTNSNYVPSPYVYISQGENNVLITGTVGHLPTGINVYRYGHFSKECLATVVSTNYSYGGYSGLYKAQILSGTSRTGDSGGPVRYGGLFCGIHKGSVDGHIIFTPYYLISNTGFVATTAQ